MWTYILTEEYVEGYLDGEFATQLSYPVLEHVILRLMDGDTIEKVLGGRPSWAGREQMYMVAYDDAIDQGLIG